MLKLPGCVRFRSGPTLPLTSANVWQPLQPALVQTAAPAAVSPVGAGLDGVVVAGGGVVVEGAVVVLLGVVVVLPGVVVVALGRGTPIPIRPFIPLAACPGTLERYSYVPRFLKVIVRVADCPGARSLVPVPLQVFRFALLIGVVQTLNVCESAPLFLTLKVTERDVACHGRADDFDSLKANSLGFPAVTVTTVASAARF